MSLFKTALVLAAAIALMPTDERRQAEMLSSAGTALNSALTYCDRNPEPCAKAQDGWAQFKRKAEFGFDLASRMVRDAMASRQASRTATAGHAPAEQVPAPASYIPRLEPEAPHGTLTPSDRSSEWRAPVRRTSY